ncbi:NACHT domain-containing protein [Nonomuraea sp. NPDC049486]|uniref:NACHT domain-containing protein n=1 Tax=Nonomuraea sp. NPDC049486 TaxID=3155773 RepID=UPI003426B9FE
MSRRRAGWRIALAVLAILAAGAVVAVVWRVLDPKDTVNRADLAAVMLAAITLAGTVAVWAHRSATAGTEPPARNSVDTAAQVLSGLVEQQWRAEARHRLLDDPEPIPVHWQLIADESVMSQPRLITTEAELTLSGRSDDIAALAEAFRSLKRRRLVIAGGAGMGKTTLAVQLLLHLLSNRAADQAAAGEGEIVPVPVLLPVSGWDTNAHPRLQDWLAVRLAQDYPAMKAPQLGGGAATALAEGGHILAVLDGLDEIPAPTRARVIAALNASLTSRDQLILTSRRAEFTTAIHEAGRPLTAAAVIVPKPLTPQAAADYLTACLPASPTEAWAHTLTALRSRTAPGLTQLAATPLGLWLIRTVYITPGTDPSPLTGPLGADADALRTHLLDHVIPALIAARPPSTDPADHFRPRHRLDPAATRRHLTYLARAFPPATTRDITWWHIARTTPHIRSTIGLTSGIVTGIGSGVYAILVTIQGGAEYVSEYGPKYGPWGLAFGFTFGLVRARPWVNEKPGYAEPRLRGRTAHLFRSLKGTLTFGLTRGLAIGLLVGLTIGLATGLDLDVAVSFEEFYGGIAHFEVWADFSLNDFTIGLVLGAFAWLPITLAHWLFTWAEQPTLASTSTPRSSWGADRTLSRLRMVVSGLTFGLTFGIPFGILSGGEYNVVFMLVMIFAPALMFGLGAGVAMGKHHAWLVCAIAVTRLALQRQLPWQVMDFLDDAHRLGLLRAIGPVYQFRHAAMHDHLAAAAASDKTPHR